MSGEDRPDIAEVIFEFLTGLPDTIKPEILLFVAIYGCDVGTTDLEEMKEVIRKQLLETGGMRKFGVVLRISAAVDYVLMRFITVSHRNQASPPMIPAHLKASEAVQRSLEMMRLRGPLTLRHAEDAQRKWNAFRAQHMSELDLVRYEEDLLRS